jgi:hypothetical protein
VRGLLALTSFPVLCASAFADAPQDVPTETVEVRVMLSSPGTLVVDRGTADLLVAGDAVVLRLKDGTKCTGKVSQVHERSSTVKLDDKSLVVPTGTRGAVTIPKARRNPPKEPAPKKSGKPDAPDTPDPKDAKDAQPPAAKETPTKAPPIPAPAKGEAKPEAAPQTKAETPDHPAWANADKDYAAGMPLLSQLRPVRPDARTPVTTGRIFSAGSIVRASSGSWSNSYARLGGEATSENLFGDGATLHVEGEVDYRTELDGNHGVDVLAYNLSYTWGGTRFDPTRLEVGRFLQFGMPEFGVLDGAEWTRRLGDGGMVGASIGFMPEPDDNFRSFEDFQFAAYYHWVQDDSERFTATVGFEKTLHEWTWDRDLVVASVRYAPEAEWDFHGTAWVDLYGSSDDEKRSAVEVTQAYLTLARHYSDGGGDLTFRHIQFPEINREGEFTPITAAEVEDNHVEELSASGYTITSNRNRLHAQVGAWSDEDENGGSADAGIEFPELLFQGLRPDFTAFGTRGQSTTIFGGRVACSLEADDGHWDLSYEFSNHRIHNFSSSVNDLNQQRLYVSRSFNLRGGWTASLNASAVGWDTDLAWSVGWYVQKIF